MTTTKKPVLAALLAASESLAELAAQSDGWTPSYSKWRHGGWYVHNVTYPSGAIGCVSCNYPDKKWRIVCHPWPFEVAPTFKSRDEAARGERAWLARERLNAAAPDLLRALRDLRKNVDTDLHGYWTESTDNFMQQADAAILKAEGSK